MTRLLAFLGTQRICWLIFALGVATLQACSSSDRIKPTELGTDPAKLTIRPNWAIRVGEVRFPLQVTTVGQRAGIAASDGTVALLDVASGAEVWRTHVGDTITAGVGTDGQTLAVVNAANEVIALRDGAIIWRYRLTAKSFTPPLVAGGRVFALAADRTVTALDGQTGHRLWVQSKQQNEALVVQQAGAVFAIGDTLVVGLSGRLSGLNPSNGSVRWDANIAFARGGNDVERLIDVIGPVSRVRDSVCVRAFQAAVGCVDALRGQVTWSAPSKGSTGVAGDEDLVFGTENDGRVLAWKRQAGQKAWMIESLLYRGLTAPASDARTVIVGDSMGFVHWLSKQDGSLLGRVQVDNSPIVMQQVLTGAQVLVVTRAGTVSSYTPQ